MTHFKTIAVALLTIAAACNTSAQTAPAAPDTINSSDHLVSQVVPKLNSNFNLLYSFPRQGVSLPATCNVGEAFILTVSSPFVQLSCTSTNTWTPRDIILATSTTTPVSSFSEGRIVLQNHALSTGLGLDSPGVYVYYKGAYRQLLGGTGGIFQKGDGCCFSFQGQRAAAGATIAMYPTPGVQNAVMGFTINDSADSSVFTATNTAFSNVQFIASTNIAGSPFGSQTGQKQLYWESAKFGTGVLGAMHMNIGEYTQAGISTADMTDINFIFGTPGGGSYANGSVLRTDANNTQGGYWQSLHTPASSSEACTAGRWADDANYHYVCTALNTWKRAALSTF